MDSLVRLPNRASSRRTLSDAVVVGLAAPVALRRVEPGMRAALVCSEDIQHDTKHS